MKITSYIIKNRKLELFIQNKGRKTLAVRADGRTVGGHRKEMLLEIIKEERDLRTICDALDELGIDYDIMDEDVESKLYDWP